MARGARGAWGPRGIQALRGAWGHHGAQDLRYLGGRSRDPGPGEALATGEALPAPPAALGAAGQRGAAPSVTF